MKIRLFIFLCLFIFFSSCKEKDMLSTSIQNKETRAMVITLDSLYNNGRATDNYHWNKRKATYLKSILNEGTQRQKDNTWFNYCRESLRAGDSQTTIELIEEYIVTQDDDYKTVLKDKNRMLFELLALAYLRLGEQENCIENHTSKSCILPLHKDGFHKNISGSLKAVELYSLLFEKYKTEQYQWLLNVAHMTLGHYPDQISQEQLIQLRSNDTLNFPYFENIAMETGVDVNGLSGSVITEDFNNDGLLDLFITSYGMTHNVQLFINSKNGFKNVTSEAGLTGITSGLNCLQADYDNDGFIDILILRGGWLDAGGKQPNSLLKNMGDGTFQDVTRSSGLLSFHPTQTASWADVDKDGDLDLFIGNEKQVFTKHYCEFFINNGDGTFTETAGSLGLGKISEYVKGVAWGDINNDGWMDLYISILGGKNRLYKNINGSFTEIASLAGVEDPFYSFPTWFWDINNDGYEDLFVNAYDLNNLNYVAGEYASELQNKKTYSQTPKLYINNGNETFTESSKQYGVDKVMFAMGSNYGDLDNDGFLDFYIGTGAPEFNSIVPNRMFKNIEGKRFEEVTFPGGFGHIQKGHGVSFADFDNDGDQDIYTVMGGAYEGDTFDNVLFENPIEINNWIKIKLEGTTSNKDALGTKIELELENGLKIYRTVSSGGSFGASPLLSEIGLGKSTLINVLKIHWTSSIQEFKNLKANQLLKITEGHNDIEKSILEPNPFKKESHSYHH